MTEVGTGTLEVRVALEPAVAAAAGWPRTVVITLWGDGRPVTTSALTSGEIQAKTPLDFVIGPTGRSGADAQLADGSATGIQAMSWSLDFGNDVKHRQLIGSENVPITDRITKGATSIEATTVAFNSWIERIRASTRSVMAVENGLTLGNIVSVWMPNVQLMDPKYSDSDGIVMLDMNYNAIPLVGNDEFRLIFK